MCISKLVLSYDCKKYLLYFVVGLCYLVEIQVRLCKRIFTHLMLVMEQS